MKQPRMVTYFRTYNYLDRNGDKKLGVKRLKDVDFFEWISSDFKKETIEAIRSGQVELKETLGAITPHATFESIRGEDFKPTNILFVDIDDKNLQYDILDIKRMFTEIEQTLAVRLSSRGKGVHAFLNIGGQDLEKCYLTMKKIMSDIGIEIDKCKDYQRICFNSYDPDVYINKDAIELQPYSDDILYPKPVVKPLGVSMEANTGDFNFADYAKYWSKDCVDGEVDNWIWIKVGQAHEKGVGMDECRTVLSQYIDDQNGLNKLEDKLRRTYK